MPRKTIPKSVYPVIATEHGEWVDQETGEDLEAKQKAEADQQPREAAAGGE